MVKQLLHGHFPHTACSADDDVVAEFFDFLFQARLFESGSVFSVHKIGCQCRNGIRERAQAAHDQDGGEEHALLRQFTDLTKSHRGHGDDRHVEGFHPRVTFNQHEAHAAHHDHAQNEGEREVYPGKDAKREHSGESYNVHLT